MGHIAHLRKQFNSINIYMIIIMLLERRKKLLFTSWELYGSSFEQTWIPFTQECFVPNGSGEDFKISSMYYCYFIIISPWKRVGSFVWTNLNSLNPRMHCVKFGWNWPSGSGKKIFYYFCYFIISSLLKRAGPFIWTNLNPLHPRMHCAKFGWN